MLRVGGNVHAPHLSVHHANSSQHARAHEQGGRAGETDLDLPMEWNGMTQAPSAVGPERREDDTMPDLGGVLGRLFTSVVCCPLISVVSCSHIRGALLSNRRCPAALS